MSQRDHRTSKANYRNRTQERRAQRSYILQKANERGIFAVRREIAPESQEIFYAIAEHLKPEIENAGRLFDTETMGITVIGFSRFTKAHREAGPPTSNIAEGVASSQSPLEVRLGRFGIYGSEAKAKLSMSLFSEDLDREIEAFETGFAQSGFPLKAYSYGEYTPHCSVGLLYGDRLGHFQDPRTLRRFNRMPGIRMATEQIVTLKPVVLETTLLKEVIASEPEQPLN